MATNAVATSVIQGNGRVTVTLAPVPDPDTGAVAGGPITLVLDEDADIEQGAVYSISLSKTRSGARSAHAQAVAAVEAARAIPNATNTRDYVTPAHLKVPPLPVPDGVVTLPRPAVVMEPVSDVPPDAGVVSAPESSTPTQGQRR